LRFCQDRCFCKKRIAAIDGSFTNATIALFSQKVHQGFKFIHNIELSSNLQQICESGYSPALKIERLQDCNKQILKIIFKVSKKFNLNPPSPRPEREKVEINEEF
jgi:hypothetical protein